MVTQIRKSTCLTNWASFFVAQLAVFGVTNALFATEVWRRVVAQALPKLNASVTSETTDVPR